MTKAHDGTLTSIAAESGQADCRLDQLNQSDTALVACGREALARLHSDRKWDDWMKFGEAVRIGRTAAMSAAGRNDPKGRRYNKYFGQWLKHYGLDGVDKADRTRLLECVDNREAIETWLEQIPPAQRLCWNHPSVVLRRWKAAMQSGDKATSGTPRIAELKQSIATLSEKNKQLKLSAVRAIEPSFLDAEPDEVARNLRNRWPPHKVESVGRALLKPLDHDRKPERAENPSNEGHPSLSSENHQPSELTAEPMPIGGGRDRVTEPAAQGTSNQTVHEGRTGRCRAKTSH
jgi:hypothetical protein